MEWNEDIEAIPYGEEVLIKVRNEGLTFCSFYLVEKNESSNGEYSYYEVTDSSEIILITEDNFIAWLYLDDEQ